MREAPQLLRVNLFIFTRVCQQIYQIYIYLVHGHFTNHECMCGIDHLKFFRAISGYGSYRILFS